MTYYESLEAAAKQNPNLNDVIILFGDETVSLRSEFGLWLNAGYPQVGKAEPETNLVYVPGSDKVLNLTRALDGKVHYKKRTITMEFSLMRPKKQWADIRYKLETILQGQWLRFYFTRDKELWDGIFDLELTPAVSKATVSIVVTCDPFRKGLVDASEVAVLGQAILGSAVLGTEKPDIPGVSTQALTGYQKQTFRNGDVLYADQLNHIEDGLALIEQLSKQEKGLSVSEKSVLLSLAEHAVYNDPGMQSIYDQLKEVWGVEPMEPEEVVVRVSSIELDKTEVSLRAGKTTTIAATVKPFNAADKTVTWSVSPAGYATVEEGKVTTLKVGKCTVTASAGEVSATCAVNVMAEPSSTSVPGETPVYKLAAAKKFVAGNQDFIDTGIRMFESIDPKPDWTILFEVQGGENASANRALLHCMSETAPYPGLTAHIVAGGYFQTNIYGSKLSLVNLSSLKAEKARYAIRIKGGSATRWLSDLSTAEASIADYNTTVSQSLLIGCYQDADGAKGRFWDGTLHQCMVFRKALTDEQIKTWLTT